MDAFDSCSFTTITIPASVTDIKVWAFWDCQNLTSIVVDSTNVNFSSESGVLFNKNKTTLIKFPNGLSGSYIIPHTVTHIADADAFNEIRNLTSVTIPSSVTNIEEYTFGNYGSIVCSITSVTFLGNIPTIQPNNFTNNNDTAYYLIGQPNVNTKLSMFTTQIGLTQQEMTIATGGSTTSTPLAPTITGLSYVNSVITVNFTRPEDISVTSMDYTTDNGVTYTSITQITSPLLIPLVSSRNAAYLIKIRGNNGISGQASNLFTFTQFTRIGKTV